MNYILNFYKRLKVELKKNIIIYNINDKKNSIKEKIKIYKKIYFNRIKIIFIRTPRSGSTYLTDVLKLIEAKLEYKILFTSHYSNLDFITGRSKYILIIRNPIIRFHSAFYMNSNNNQGTFYHKNHEIWKKYKDINELCENLLDENYANEAKKLINRSHHMSISLSQQFSIVKLKKYQPYFIFELENLKSDINQFLKKNNLVFDINLFNNIENENDGLYYKKFKLSKKSIKNLEIFLKKDFEIYNYLKENKFKINYIK
jgi:hypothetical protein